MWHRRIYEQTENPRYVYRSKIGYVRDHGSTDWNEVSPDYSHEGVVVSGDEILHPEYYSGWMYRNISSSGFDTYVSNKLYAKLAEKLASERMNALTSLAEVGSSYHMIADRAIQLRKAFTALRHFDLPQVAKHLMLPRKVQRNVERRVSKKHLVTQNWLEYWMGWAPLMNDISVAVSKTSHSPSGKKLRVVCSLSEPTTVGSYGPNGSEPTWFYWYGTGTIVGRFTWGGRFQVVNPNLILASELGLLTPIQTAWQLVPFSFIADWFANVDTYLQGSSIYYGYNVTHTYGNLRSRCTGQFRNTHWEWTGAEWRAKHALQRFQVDGFFRRAMHVPTPELAFELPDRLSLTRAATSISLLTQLFVKT